MLLEFTRQNDFKFIHREYCDGSAIRLLDTCDFRFVFYFLHGFYFDLRL